MLYYLLTAISPASNFYQVKPEIQQIVEAVSFSSAQFSFFLYILRRIKKFYFNLFIDNTRQ